MLSMVSKFLSVFFFQGHVKEVEWIKNKIEEAENKVQARFEKYMKMLFVTAFCCYFIATYINRIFHIEFYVFTCLLVYSNQ